MAHTKVEGVMITTQRGVLISTHTPPAKKPIKTTNNTTNIYDKLLHHTR